jgi:SiaC family regulatory phosphoprotein
MEPLHIPATVVSPEIIFDPSQNKFSISGWSRPESPSKFYDPIIKWLNENGRIHLNNTVIDFKIEYFNTPSARVLREIFGQLDKLYREGTKVSINWYFEDVGSKEEFEYEFAQGLTIPINFLEKK